MIIRPVLPAPTPELGGAPSLRTLPFQRDTSFLELLKAATTAKAGTGGAPANHEVRSGDSLWRICENALSASGSPATNSDINAAVHRVAAANKLKDADVLVVGQKLNLSALRESVAYNGNPIQDKAAKLPVPLNSLQTSMGKRTNPVETRLQVTQTSRQPLATFARPANPMGGALSTTRPIFHRLSNARPTLHLHPTTPPATNDTPTTKSVDLSALMQTILEPGSVTPRPSTAAGPWGKLLAGSGRFTSGFGVRSDPFSGKPQFHQGIDIAASAGTEIFPYMPGTVKSVGWDAGHGKNVVVQHPNGMETLYAHASETLVKAGDVVLNDTPIAKVGSTGRSTGPHLHFEVRQNNKAVNPLPLIRQNSLDVAKAL